MPEVTYGWWYHATDEPQRLPSTENPGPDWYDSPKKALAATAKPKKKDTK